MKNFKNEIELLDNIYNINENFFDIYNFVGLYVDDDLEQVKSEYEELIKSTKLNKTTNMSHQKSNTYFEIYLNVLKQKNKYLNNVDFDIYLDLDVQINLLKSILQILSNIELKNIYDKYHLDWKINYMKTNSDLETEGKKKLDLIDKVYSNLFFTPAIKLNRTIDNLNNIIDDFETRKNEYIKSFNEQQKKLLSEPLSEQPPEKYNKSESTTYQEMVNNSEKYNNEINKILSEILHPNIKYDDDNFLHNIIKKYNLEEKDKNVLLNYYLYNKINWKQNKKSYDTFTNFVQYGDSKYFSNMFDDYAKIFEENFDISDFYEWEKMRINDNNKDIQKNVIYFNKDLNNLLKNRKNDDELFKKFINDKLNHFEKKVYEFNPVIYHPEMDYSSNFFYKI